jgi:hypothetical protein
MWSFPPRALRLLRLALVVFVALYIFAVLYTMRQPPTPSWRVTWGHCWFKMTLTNVECLNGG